MLGLAFVRPSCGGIHQWYTAMTQLFHLVSPVIYPVARPINYYISSPFCAHHSVTLLALLTRPKGKNEGEKMEINISAHTVSTPVSQVFYFFLL